MLQLWILMCLMGSLFGGEQEECCFTFHAETRHAPTPLFSPTEKSSFVPQIPKVNLVTGEYCEDACDLVVAGIEPLSIRRFYNHLSGHEECICGHWRINPEAFMLFNFAPVEGAQVFMGAGQSDGSFLCCDREVGNTFEVDKSKNKGFCNSFSGQNHPLNSRVVFTRGHVVRKVRGYEPEDLYWWEGTIEQGDGCARTFKTDLKHWPQSASNEYPYREYIHPTSHERIREYLYFRPPYQAQILEERKPNGNLIRYEYIDCATWYQEWDSNFPSNYALKGIKAYSSSGHLLGAIDVTYSGHHPLRSTVWLVDAVAVKGSDGRSAHFDQPHRVIAKPLSYDTLLANVKAQGKPTDSYDYLNCRNRHGFYDTPPYLCRVTRGDHVLYETIYNKEDKVSSQNAPIGPNGKMVPCARYVYGPSDTRVYDGENNQTLYRFNADQRVVAIERYQGDSCYSIESNEWDAETGNLLKKTIQDAAGTVFLSVAYRYDRNHNVIEETVLGGYPITRTYSDDGFNLKLTESDRPWKEIRYTYVPQTNLISSEITTHRGQIVKRTFHFYDPEITSVCVRTIVDDGHTDDPRDLSGVTFRHVTEISPKRTFPCLGLPEEMREYAGERLLKKVRYTYHPSGQIASEEHYDSENRHRYTLHNTYDACERLISKTDALGNQTIFTYDNNFNRISQRGPRSDQYTEWRYDAANRPVEQLEWQTDGTVLISEHKYDKASRLIATIDPSGFETRYDYDAFGRLIATHHPDGGIELKEYDILGNVTQETDPCGYITRKSYNFRGKPTAIYHPDGTEEHFIYNDIEGTLASHTNTHGVTTRYIYDLYDNLIRSETGFATTKATYSGFRLLSETDPLGVTTYLTYDLVGRKIGERKGEKELTFVYNELGQISQTQEGDICTLFTYDLKGQLLEKKIEGYFQENYAYDEAGNQITRTTCEGSFHTQYNAKGSPVLQIDPLGNTTRLSYSYQGGLTTTICNPQGVTTTILHDFRSKPIDLQIKNNSGTTIQRELRKYDLSGNQTQATHFIYEGTTLNKTITHSWDFGPQKRLERFLEAGEKETRYLYDTKGRLQALIKPDGQPIYRTYDPLSRLARLYGEGIDYCYDYDLKNRLTTITDNVRKTTLESTYDIYDNVISEKLDNGIVIRKEIDPYGRRTALHIPDTTPVTYTYQGPYIHTITHRGLTHTYAQRNLSGRPTKLILPNNQTATIEWDALFRWKTFQSTYLNAAYTYDTVGNLTHYTYTDPQGRESLSYRYDDLHQLVSENGHHYGYDSLYNRTQKDNSSYDHNDLQQLISDTIHTYHYDPNGNLLSDGINTYEYDLLDRLISHTKDSIRTHYTYDAQGRRISKNNDNYIWDGQQEIGMIRGGSIKELRILGEGKGAEIGAAVIIEIEKTPFIPIHDHRGSVVLMLTMYDKPYATYRYTAFGETTHPHPISPWQFASKRLDRESNLIYFGKRYYNPSQGRWLTPDPQGFQDGPNLYTYVQNNPLLYIDPYGLIAKSLSETHNPFDLCGLFWYYTCSAIEWIGHNLVPLPGVCDLIESTGRWAYGGDFNVPKERPSISTSPGKHLANTHVCYVNGIAAPLQKSAAPQRDAISKTHGDTAVTLYHKPSNGLAFDFLACLAAKCGIKSAFDRMIAQDISQRLIENPELNIIFYGHSHGGTRINNSTSLLSLEECARISVTTFGSATLISRGGFQDVKNYVSKCDPVPCTSAWNYFKSVAGFDSTTIFLSPTTPNPLTEHYLLGDTYWQQMDRLGQKFVEKHYAN